MSAPVPAAAPLVALSGPSSAAEPRRRQTQGALDLAVWGVAAGLLAFVLLGCGKNSSSNSTTPTTPSPVATREVTVLDFDDCIHLGDDVRTDLCPRRTISSLGSRQLSRTFTVTSAVIEGRLTLRAVDVGPIGAEVRLNGVIVFTLPPPLGEGEVSTTIAGDAFRVGVNALVIRARQDGNFVEDFQLDLIRLVVLVPVG
jgi:hypothetical protein